MPRRRTNPYPSECVRLRPTQLLQTIGSLAAAPGNPVVIWLDGREGPKTYPLIAALAERHDDGAHYFALAIVPPPFKATSVPVSQVVMARPTTDSRGRSRHLFVCRGPGGPSPVEVLYLAPGSDRFRCRHCCRILYRLYPPEPLGAYQPPWDTMLPRLEADCRKLQQAAEELLAQFPPTPPAPTSRPTRGVTPARRRRLQQRQLAVAHLWGQCGWEETDLAALFSVSPRSIKRDLRRARATSEAPRCRTAQFAPQLVEHAPGLIAESVESRRCARQTAAAMNWSQQAVLWLHGTDARLLREEMRLTRVLARLAGRQPLTVPYSCARAELAGLFEPLLIKQACACIEDAIQKHMKEPSR